MHGQCRTGAIMHGVCASPERLPYTPMPVLTPSYARAHTPSFKTQSEVTFKMAMAQRALELGSEESAYSELARLCDETEAWHKVVAQQRQEKMVCVVGMVANMCMRRLFTARARCSCVRTLLREHASPLSACVQPRILSRPACS